MMSQTVQNAINDQIKHEFYSSYLYLSMSAYFETLSLPGFAQWMRVQSQEEHAHAMKFFDFVNDRGGSVELQAIEQPPGEFQSPLDVFEQALGHERKVTALIHWLYELALKESDYPTQMLLQWFITEQVEEEKNAGQIVEQLKMTGGEPSALLLLDRELAGRGATE
ncbi:MAG TPA: ferritin [Roseiflexaceae bacterium]|nr:ferritin [Roseiflexaceae bacterium]